jgi:hypothetical protein
MTAYQVLFIGNSHTYLHHMPQMVVRLVEATNLAKPLNAEQVTGKGVDLEWHWHNQKTRDRIKAKKWDYVVLQDRSGGPLENKASMFKHARLLDDEIKKQGAGTILYMTWANRKRPETQKILTDTYSRISRELGAILAPVGAAWENSLKTDTDLRLHHSDDRHAGPAGAYLTACVFYTVLYRSSPQGLPGTLYLDKRLLVDLTDDKAAFLQRVAFETVTSLR